MAPASKNVDIDTDDDEYDIVIVGSGLTGLTAAYTILKRHIGLSVLILERNDLVGGRILLEENSQAFYGNFRQKHIAKLINELDVLTEAGPDVDGKRLVFFTKNGPLIDEVSSLVSGQVYHFLKLLEAISIDSRYGNNGSHEDNETLAETSIDRLMRKSVYLPQARTICRSLLYACCGIENLENISALWFIAMLHGAGGLFEKLSTSLGDEQRFFVKGGFVKLVKELERKIVDERGTIICSETVVKIELTNDRVYVRTNLKKFKCNYVVIAVPPPASIRIPVVEPPVALPELLLNSQSLYESAKNLFFYATYREPFWSENLSGSMIGTEDSESSLKITYDATHPAFRRVRVLAGLLSASTDSHSQRSVFGALKRCYRTREASRCIGYNVGPAASSVHAMKPCSIRYHINPMLVSLERIFFAGSEYATYWPGTADGAVEAGETVARSIIFRARPQALDGEQRNTSISPSRYKRIRKSFNGSPAIAGTHLICLGLNVCLFFFLLRDSYENV